MRGSYNILLFVSLVFVLIGFASPIFIGWKFNHLGYDSFQDFGPIGDWIGGSSTPLFTLATFIIVVAAFLVQREELKNTTAELAMNREEMRLSRLEMEKQNQNLNKQGFESTFFKMISLHNEIVGAMRAAGSGHGKNFEGRVSFGYFHSILQSTFKQLNERNEHREKIKDAYNRMYEMFEPSLGHYFVNLLAVLQIIHEARLSEEDKKMYAGILRAQLSSHEITLILYHCLSTKGHPLCLYINEYDIVGNINHNLLLHPDDLELFIDLYKESNI